VEEAHQKQVVPVGEAEVLVMQDSLYPQKVTMVVPEEAEALVQQEEITQVQTEAQVVMVYHHQ
jgi:folate-dependent tRNA-U54 methylase TrmFO/GidA